MSSHPYHTGYPHPHQSQQPAASDALAYGHPQQATRHNDIEVWDARSTAADQGSYYSGYGRLPDTQYDQYRGDGSGQGSNSFPPWKDQLQTQPGDLVDYKQKETKKFVKKSRRGQKRRDKRHEEEIQRTIDDVESFSTDQRGATQQQNYYPQQLAEEEEQPSMAADWSTYPRQG